MLEKLTHKMVNERIMALVRTMPPEQQEVMTSAIDRLANPYMKQGLEKLKGMAGK